MIAEYLLSLYASTIPQTLQRNGLGHMTRKVSYTCNLCNTETGPLLHQDEIEGVQWDIQTTTPRIVFVPRDEADTHMCLDCKQKLKQALRI